MSDVQITKTFNGWLLEDKDDNLWSYSDSEVDGFIDQLSQLIDLQMVLSSDSPFYGGEMPLQTSPEQPSYKHPEKDIFNLSEEVLPKGGDTKLPDSPTEETIQAAVSEVTPSAPEEIETFRGGAHFSSPFNGQAQE